MVLNGGAWADLPDGRRLWVLALCPVGDRLGLVASVAALAGHGLRLPLTGEVVWATGARTQATASAQQMACVLDVAGDPVAARFEVATGRS